MTDILDSRSANALFAQARLSAKMAASGVDFGLLGTGDAAGSSFAVLDRFARQFGGLWVGGTATLTRRALVFEPNAMNRAVHEDGSALRLDLPLDAIDRVSTRTGFVSGIIDVEAKGAVFSLRCFRAGAFASAIEEARRAAAGSPAGGPGN